MGTSKGYIAPTRIPWSQAKRAVTQMLRDGDTNSIARAASRYATAMKADASLGSTFTNAVTSILKLQGDITSHGLYYVLDQHQRLDLLEKTSNEILDELFYEYTHYGATTEDALAADALSKALTNLNIMDLNQLGKVSQEVLLKEMLIEYVVVNFDFRFAEKIGKDRTPADAFSILSEMKDYIRNSLYEKLSIEDIKNIDFTGLSGNQYVDTVLVNAYSVFEELYLED